MSVRGHWVDAVPVKGTPTPGPWDEVIHFVDSADPEFDPTEQGVYEIVRANEDINLLRRDGQHEEAKRVADANVLLIKAAPSLEAHLAEMQRHRDAWRGHAYGRRERPTDFIDSNMVEEDRGATTTEKLTEGKEALEAVRRWLPVSSKRPDEQAIAERVRAALAFMRGEP